MTDHDKTARELLDSLLHYVGRADHYPDEYAKVAAALARAEAEGARRERERLRDAVDAYAARWTYAQGERANLVALFAAPPEPASSRLPSGTSPPYIQVGMRLRTDRDHARWWEVYSIGTYEYGDGTTITQAHLRSNDVRTIAVDCAELRASWVLADDFHPDVDDE